jgi:hypothetical protein
MVSLTFVTSVNIVGGTHADIWFRRSGLTPPVHLSIGGVDLGYAKYVNDDHTLARWDRLFMALDFKHKSKHDVVLTTALLPPYTHSKRFEYVEPPSSGCSVQAHAHRSASGLILPLGMLLFTAALAAIARQRMRNTQVST